MKETFTSVRFRADSITLIDRCNEIIEDYQGQGLRLTLRQLYYQLVSRDLIPNTERSYKRVGSVLSDARLAGMVDWDAIEDRGRLPSVPQDFENLADLARTAVNAYRLPRWNDQPCYVELWVEKDALSGVLRPLANEFHVTLCVNKGYSSQSAMYVASKRFIEQAHKESRTLLYLGDHDPSGEDMVRDIEDRLTNFGADLTVNKIALTMAQVQKYRPPPNPAKTTDSRFAAYAEKHGTSSWEVDALPPEVLHALVRSHIENFLLKSKWKAVLSQEKSDKATLLDLTKDL